MDCEALQVVFPSIENPGWKPGNVNPERKDFFHLIQRVSLRLLHRLENYFSCKFHSLHFFSASKVRLRYYCKLVRVTIFTFSRNQVKRISKHS